MADNFLEKRQEAYREKAAKGGAKKTTSLIKLAAKSLTDSFDLGYKVRPDQLCKIVEAGRLLNKEDLAFYIVPDDVAPILRPYLAKWLQQPLSYIILGVDGMDNELQFISLGCALQMMLVQVAEIGLAAAVSFDFDKKEISNTLSLSFTPLVIVTVGRASK